MDEDLDINQLKFLKCLGKPFKSAFGILTLKSGVIILSIIDIIISVFSLLYLSSSLHILQPHKMIHLSEGIRLLMSFMKVLNIPFTLIGLKGIIELDKKLLSLYCKFEIFEVCAQAALDVLSLEVTIFRHGSFHIRLFMAKLIIFLFFNVFSFVSTKIIWSSCVMIENGSIEMVLYGEDAVKLMRESQVGRNKMIEPGMEIKIDRYEDLE